ALRAAAVAALEELVAIDGDHLEVVAVLQGLVAFEAAVDLHQHLAQAGAVGQGVDPAERVDAGGPRADQAAQARGEADEVLLEAVEALAVAAEQGEDAGEDTGAWDLRSLARVGEEGQQLLEVKAL